MLKNTFGGIMRQSVKTTDESDGRWQAQHPGGGKGKAKDKNKPCGKINSEIWTQVHPLRMGCGSLGKTEVLKISLKY
jgi:hypothetical protein